jgi:hypothetical protein
MAARRRLEEFDDTAEEDGGTAHGGWRLILTEQDEIDEIARRDADEVSRKVRQKLEAEAVRAA